MSALYGSMKGTKGETTRCGHSRIYAHLRGWTLGAFVEVTHEKKTKTEPEKTTVKVYATEGSNGGRRKLVAEFSDFDSVICVQGLTELLSPTMGNSRKGSGTASRR